jgi:hypothetical protein
LKKDVQKQLPGKFEHVIWCRLSKRQRNLYEDFMASSDTQATLSSSKFLGLINVLMQLRKVCNHPDLFEGRPIISSFNMAGMEVHLSSLAWSAMRRSPLEGVDLETLNLQLSGMSGAMSRWEAEEVAELKTPGALIMELASTGEDTWGQQQSRQKPSREVRSVMEEIQSVVREKSERRRRERVAALWTVNEFRCGRQPVYGTDLVKRAEVLHPVYNVHRVKASPRQYLEFSSIVSDMVQLPLTQCERVMDVVTAFMFAIPAARAPVPVVWCSHAKGGGAAVDEAMSEEVVQEASRMLVPLQPVVVRRELFFPDRRLLQFDYRKLQELAVLFQRLKSKGHRALIFTQMTKMLDNFCHDLVALLIRVNDLRKHGVMLYLGIDKERENVPDVPAIYFVQLVQSNVERIIVDASRGMYEAFHLNFSLSLPWPLLEELAMGILKSDSLQRIAKVYDQYLEFVTLENGMFSLAQPLSYVQLNDPATQDQDVEAVVESIATGLFSVLATLKSQQQIATFGVYELHGNESFFEAFLVLSRCL